LDSKQRSISVNRASVWPILANCKREPRRGEAAKARRRERKLATDGNQMHADKTAIEKYLRASDLNLWQ
jgi:hypothetical protein